MITRKDLPIGIAMFVIALLILWHVQSFPPSPGQPYNAALFPGIAAAGLGLAALMLIIQSLRGPSGPPPEAPKPGDDAAGAPAEPPAFGQRLLAAAITAGSILFYLFFAEWLGFVITGSIVLIAAMWVFGVRPGLLLPVGIGTALVIHLLFYKLLKVPLPWGVLQPFAW